MRKMFILAILLLQTALLLAYLDFEKIYGFDLGNPYSFVVPISGEGSYYYLETGGVVEAQLMPWMQGWKQGNVNESTYVGFKTSIIDLLNPIYSPSEPAFVAYTPFQTDPQGDQAIEDANLDILESRVSFGDDRLYYAIRNATGLYPLNSGFNFNAYMPILANPNFDIENAPVAYGLVYTVNMGTLLSPGLYKITGTTLEGVQRLGDIQFSVQGEWLLLSCALSDLYADPDMGEWLIPDYPMFASATATGQLNLSTGIQAGDYSIPGLILLKPQFVNSENSFSPVLSDISYELNPDATLLNNFFVTYSDADANVPHQAYLSIDGAAQYLLELQNPDTVDFGINALYGIGSLDLPQNWESLDIVFSDGAAFVEEHIANPSATDDEIQIPAFALHIYPNPVRSQLKISSALPSATSAAIYNLRGQKLQDLRFESGKSESILDLSHYPAGIYLLKGKGIRTQKFAIVH
ncbi:MAG: T9SS type A sorting domain-containing protein [Candidatus Cloacimonetes bacterium]|jgi:hypothetical protein|nr:T9SS type A sorting domain-containing protein [Candidatus Cloacimonadota bacterium]MDD2506672.1 T9SS type A sorting domain-containing protein [Candidatus Cloacimonadota bacterium]MDD4559964.1 T9SS type A sorting domain-containing protein [Candidatus Cloacimonadota bacterium]